MKIVRPKDIEAQNLTVQLVFHLQCRFSISFCQSIKQDCSWIATCLLGVRKGLHTSNMLEIARNFFKVSHSARDLASYSSILSVAFLLARVIGQMINAIPPPLITKCLEHPCSWAMLLKEYTDIILININSSPN